MVRVPTFSTSSSIDGAARAAGKALAWPTLALFLWGPWVVAGPGERFTQVLRQLADLPYVTCIQPAWFE